MNEEDERPSFVVPALLSAAQTAFTIAAIVAALSIAYLLYGIFSHQLDGYSGLGHAERLRVKTNLGYAGIGLQGGMIVGSICAAICFFGAESTGWVLLVAAAAIGFGVPFAFTNIGGGATGDGIKMALAPFLPAAIPPGAIGAFLVVKDLILKTTAAVKTKVFDSNEMQFGTGAVKESRPTRTSVLGKCWEGPYCRTFIREHCPIFIKRQACWKNRRGCYCDEDIVSGAAAKVKGVMLEMAPASETNFSAPVQTSRKVILTEWQKAERCRNCIIYNEHQREKYRVFMPIVILGTIAGAAAFSQPAFALVKIMITRVDHLVQSLSFGPAGSTPKHFVEIADWAVWSIVLALSVMLISKVLQTLEYLIFVKKI